MNKNDDILRNFKTKYPDYIIVIALAAIGDLCYSFSYIDIIKQQRQKKLLVVTYSYVKELMNYYPVIDKLIFVNGVNFESLVKYCNSTIEKRFYEIDEDVFVCNPLDERTYNLINEYSINYIDILNSIYTNSTCQKPLYPKVEIFSTEYLGIGNYKKTAIINPYSNSLKINNEIFYEIIDLLNKLDFVIYTNVTNQKPLNGTKELKCSLSEFYNIVKRAKICISVRSGILDFAADSGGNFIVIYNDEKNHFFRNAYALSGWKASSRFAEFDISEKGKILVEVRRHALEP